MAPESHSEGEEQGPRDECIALDQISVLPDSILTTILCLLPLIEAARTSILSQRWRYLWNSIPHLHLLDTICNHSPPTLDGQISIIYQILHSRRAPIHTCNLPIFRSSTYHLDNFFFFLHKLGIQHLLLRNQGGAFSPISANLFFCQSLKKLVIEDLPVSLPSGFKQLSNLYTLHLIGARIYNRQLEVLVSRCPSLENLRLSECRSLSDLRICGSNLLSLDISMDYPMRFSLIDAPRLKRVHLTYSLGMSYDSFDSSSEEEEEEVHNIKKDECGKLIELLMNPHHLESFSIHCCERVFKYTSRVRLPDKLPTRHQLVHLKELFMKLDLDDARMVVLLLFLLRSCPNLETLALQDVRWKTKYPLELDYWEKQRPPECLIDHLMKIQLEDICLSSKNVIEFVKFLLLNANVLSRMRLHYSIEDKLEENVVKELSLLERASPYAVLEIKP